MGILRPLGRVGKRIAANVEDRLTSAGRRLLDIPLSRLLALGLVLRLILAPFTSWNHDVYTFYRVAMDMLGGLDPYDTGFYTYPPLWAYALFPIFSLAGLVGDPAALAAWVPSIGPTADLTEMIVPTVTSPAFNLLLKLPLIAADLGIALVLLRWVSLELSNRAAKVAFLLWFLNPLVIWVNAAHGQFDVIPAFFTLASGLLIVRRRHLWAGLALGLAILFKIYPLFLLIPLVFLVIALERRASAGKRWTPRSLKHPLLFVSGAAIALIAFGLPLLTTRFIEVAIVRRSQFAIFGGFNPFFFLALDIWEQFPLARAFLLPLPRLSYPYLLVLPIIVSIVAGLAVLRRSTAIGTELGSTRTLSFLTLLPLVALYSALVLVNPQHLLWILPFLALAAARWRELVPVTIVVSLAGIAFFLSLQGVAAFFYPAAVFTPFITAESINSQISAYWNLPGVLSSRLRKDLLFLTSGLGYISLLVAARQVIVRWRQSDAQAATPSGARGPASRPLSIAVLPVAILLILVSAQGVVMNEGLPPQGSLQAVVYDHDTGTVDITIRGHGLYDVSYRVTVLGLSRQPTELPIYLYYDEVYPVSNTSRPRVLGILDHLRSELSLAGMPADTALVDAAGLLDVLRGPRAVLLVPSTVLPDILYFSNPGLLREWIESGGILIWVGALLGAYVGTTRGDVVDMSRYAPDVWGPPFILGFDPVGGEGSQTASVPTQWSTALDIRFPLTSWGARASQVEERQGLVLGSLSDDGRTSLSLIPLGEGTVALFGNATGVAFTYSAEDIVAHDIARLLLSGLLHNPSATMATLLHSESITVPAGGERRLSFQVSPPENATVLRVLAFSQADFDPLLASVDLPL
jgi:hypothetical protein